MSVSEHKLHGGCKFPGKKSGDLKIDIDRSERATYPLRVDTETGDWIAVDGDRYFKAATKKELADHMTQVARTGRSVEWARYIVVKYHARIPGTNFGSQHVRLGDYRKPADEDRKLTPCTGFELVVEVWDYSQPITSVGSASSERTRRKERQVHIDRAHYAADDENAHYTSPGWRGIELGKGTIPYTPSRLAYFLNVQQALAHADRRICALLTGTPKELADAIDAEQIDNAMTSGGSIRQLLGGGR